jgi:hypothetical protein
LTKADAILYAAAADEHASHLPGSDVLVKETLRPPEDYQMFTNLGLGMSCVTDGACTKLQGELRRLWGVWICGLMRMWWRLRPEAIGMVERKNCRDGIRIDHRWVVGETSHSSCRDGGNGSR